MDRDNSQIFHTVVITGLKDPSKDKKVALALSRIIKNMPPDKILKRLESLPWTLTRKATPKNATRLSRYLDKVGARVKVAPPLAASVMMDIAETQILPDTHLLSQTQVMSTTQIMSTTQDMPVSEAPPPQPRAATPAWQPPPPIAPGRKIEPPVAPIPKQAPPPQADPPDEGGFDIEPLSLGGMLDRTFQICRAHFWKLLAVIGVAAGIGAAIGILAVIVAVITGLTYDSLGKASLWVLVPIGVVLIPVTFVVFIALIYVSKGALVYAVSSVYLGREIQVLESYYFALGRLRKLVFTYILVSLLMLGIIFAGTLAGAAVYFLFYTLLSSAGWAVACSFLFWLALVCVPLYVAIRLLLIDKVIIIEDMGYTDAIKRTWNLLSGKAGGGWPKAYFWRLALLWILFVIIQQVVSMLFRAPGQVLMYAGLLPVVVAQILNQVLSISGSLVAGLFSAVCMVIFYYDIRNRKEGFDLKMLGGMHEE